MTQTVLDLLHAQTDRTNASSRMLANDLRTTAFAQAFIRVLDHHPEIRNLWDQVEFAERMAHNSLVDAADLLLEMPIQVAVIA